MARPRFEMRWAVEGTAAALTARYRGGGRAAQRMRRQGLWRLWTGQSAPEMAAAVGVHRRTVDRWVGGYRVGSPRCSATARVGTAGHAS